jgi:hypothetical protein
MIIATKVIGHHHDREHGAIMSPTLKAMTHLRCGEKLGLIRLVGHVISSGGSQRYVKLQKEESVRLT